MNGSTTGVIMNNTILIGLMNTWLGRPFQDSFDKLFINIDTGELNKNGDKYKELIK